MGVPGLRYEKVRVALPQSSLPAVAQHMYCLMTRNIASDGFVFTDPLTPGGISAPGCVIAAPTYAAESGVNQDYVFNWVRDAAITAMELAAAGLPAGDSAGVQPLIDYVNFAQKCQDSQPPTIGHACYTIEGQPRPWTEQSDGPALQTLAILQAFPQLDAPTQATAASVISTNVSYLLGAYQNPTTNLWEEKQGYSFFARAAALRCFQALSSNTAGIPVPPATADAITWLQNALAGHWNGSYYVSVLSPQPN